ncbi:unnamed protein product [Symbiodinium necroappetens]|uniref:Uncharacterized protein n=1 Tax=Symbiodinium necroappetens TaxID=1628268 RepID=A0A813BQE3_9DINO|nr:unnamed protein product [Symbiodinium necroappetens]
MIVYQPGSWGVGFALRLHGSVFPRAFAPAGICAAFAMLLHWLLRLDAATLEVIGTGAPEQNVFDGFTFVLGFLIVFRSQQAYSRWWEGGTLLQQLRGEWFNSYSCLIAFCNGAPEKKEVPVFRETGVVEAASDQIQPSITPFAEDDEHTVLHEVSTPLDLAQEQLVTKRQMTRDGEWPFLEWFSDEQAMIES